MNLEPGRTSLSGRPEFLRPLAPVQTSAPAAPERRCSSCNLLGHFQLREGVMVNTVHVELRFLESAIANEAMARQKIAGRLAAKGWRYKFHLAKHAMERLICLPCMVGQKEMQDEFRRKRTNELKSSMQSDSYYLALCGD